MIKIYKKSFKPSLGPSPNLSFDLFWRVICRVWHDESNPEPAFGQLFQRGEGGMWPRFSSPKMNDDNAKFIPF